MMNDELKSRRCRLFVFGFTFVITRAYKRDQRLPGLVSIAWLCDDLVVISMRSDPEPVNTAVNFDCKGPIVSAHAYGPEIADLLEMKRGIPGI